MKTYDITRFPNMIELGHDGENNWRPQAFDCSSLLANHQNGVLTLWLLPQGESQAFPVAVQRDGNVIVWTPLNEEMTTEYGSLQIQCDDGTDVGKSDTAQYHVKGSLVSGAAHPATMPSWAARVVEATGHYPKIINGNWYVWDVQNGEWSDTGVSAGGDVSPEQIAEAIEEYFDEHPIQAPVQSVNGKTGAVVLGASDVGALPSDTVIPPAVTEQDVAGWGFTKNTGTYSKPSGGIPKTDLASDVQTSLGKADSAYQKPSGGIPASDLVVGVIPDISGKVDKVTGHGLASSRVVTNGYELAINENGTVSNLLVVGISSYNTAMQQASQALAAKADASSVYTKTEIDNKGYQTAAQVQSAIAAIPDELPTVTASDNGKFLRVVSGAWAAASVPSAESNSFGGGA